jgi:hypothetical protein
MKSFIPQSQADMSQIYCSITKTSSLLGYFFKPRTTEGVDDKEDVLTLGIIIGVIWQGSLEQIFSAK